ncbi:hypothetical protein ACQKWADRAFT_302311 [Trichoderma austrokoningii]
MPRLYITVLLVAVYISTLFCIIFSVVLLSLGSTIAYISIALSYFSASSSTVESIIQFEWYPP